MKLRHLVAASVLFVAACAGPHREARIRSGVEDLAPGDFFAPGRGRLGLAAVAAAAGGARYVLVGESHDNRCDHRAQAAVVAALADAGRAPAIGLEQVDVERQPVLDRFSRGELDLAALPAALDWKAKWGIDFSRYRPIFAVAADRRLPVVALNLPAELVRAFGATGAAGLPPERRALLPAEILPPPAEQETTLRRAFEAHHHGDGGAAAGPGGEDPVARFARVQSLWDTTMAARAIDAARRLDRPVAILAGAGHVERGWGIESRLARLDPGGAVISILPWRGEEDPDPADADLFFYCPGDSTADRTGPRTRPTASRRPTAVNGLARNPARGSSLAGATSPP
jgi:uncharacterized iron-regulated protein